MFISKKHVPRRTVLQGIGATIGLPLLGAMFPAATAWAQTAAGKTPKRFAFVGFPHGAIMDRWSPKETGTDYTMSPILEPLEPFRQHLTIVSGLRNKPAETPEPHAYIEQGWLTCVKPWDFGKAGPDSGVSCDQIAVRYIGQDTRLPSLELTTAQGSARLAWRTPTQSLAAGRQPARGLPEALRRGRHRSGTRPDPGGNRQYPGSRDGTRRDACRPASACRTASWSAIISTPFARLSAACRWPRSRTTPSWCIPDAPVGTPNDITEYFKLMFDLMALAFQADITRVITFSMDREASMRTYTNLGISEGFHPLSHHGNNPREDGQAGEDSEVPHASVCRIHQEARRPRKKPTAPCSIIPRFSLAAT